MRIIRSWACAARALLVVACALVSATERGGLATAQSTSLSAKPAAKLRRASASGTLCGARGKTMFRSPDSWKGGVSALVVDAKIDTFAVSGRAVSSECVVDFEWEIPSGHQFKSTAFIQEEFMQLGGASAESSATYTFEGAQPEVFRWTPLAAGPALRTHTLVQWSPSCGSASGATTTVRLRMRLRITVSGGKQGIYSLDGFDLPLANQATWRRCGST